MEREDDDVGLARSDLWLYEGVLCNKEQTTSLILIVSFKLVV